jgi:hypothetical protein
MSYKMPASMRCLLQFDGSWKGKGRRVNEWGLAEASECGPAMIRKWHVMHQHADTEFGGGKRFRLLSTEKESIGTSISKVKIPRAPNHHSKMSYHLGSNGNFSFSQLLVELHGRAELTSQRAARFP